MNFNACALSPLKDPEPGFAEMKGKRKAKAGGPAGKAVVGEAGNAAASSSSPAASKRKAKTELKQEPAQKGASPAPLNKRKKATESTQQCDAEDEEVKRLKLPGVRAVLPRIVPWRDWDEWEFVGNALLDGSYTEKTHAVCRVRAWQSRGKVSHISCVSLGAFCHEPERAASF